MEDRRQHGAYRREDKHYQNAPKRASKYDLKNAQSVKTRDFRCGRLITGAEGRLSLRCSGHHRAVLWGAASEAPPSGSEQAAKGNRGCERKKGRWEKLQRPFDINSGYVLSGKAQRQVRAPVTETKSRPRNRN
jgi:hypothetical protein